MNEELQNMFTEGPVREAMMVYLSTNYEEAADYSEESIIREYIYLKDNGQLNVIFQAVQLQNQCKTLATN